MAFSSPLKTFCRLPPLTSVLLGEAAVSRLIGIAFETQFSSMVRVCCLTLIMPNGPYAFGIKSLCGGLFVVMKQFVFIASASLSSSTKTILLKTGLSRTY